jgi:hypothetical protein
MRDMEGIREIRGTMGLHWNKLIHGRGGGVLGGGDW